MIYHTFPITFIYSIFIYRGFIEMYSYNTLYYITAIMSIIF